MDFRLAACRMYYPVACEDVCDLIMRREANGGFSTPSVSNCEVAFFGDTVAVKMSFESFDGGDSCGDDPPIFEGGIR